MKHLTGLAVALLVLACPIAQADENPNLWSTALAQVDAADADLQAPTGTWLAAAEDVTAPKPATAAAPAGDGPPPLPLHTTEGVGGALTVPMAYLVNPGPEGTVVGKPAVSFTYIYLGPKSIQSFAITETLWGRLELGYAWTRFDLGNLPHVVRKQTGGSVSINRQEVNVHNFNVRGLLIKENTEICGIPMPALVAGATVKVNGGIQGIDHSAGGAFTSVGLERSNGIDYTLTASKMFPTAFFGRPLILTLGGRNSKASNFGATGFGNRCVTTVEADIATLITDNVAVGYEFRQRANPYDKIDALLGDETNLHAIRFAYIINSQMTIAGAWAFLGPIGNSNVDCSLGVQLKYEF